MSRTTRIYRVSVAMAGAVALIGCAVSSNSTPPAVTSHLGAAEPSVHDPGPGSHGHAKLPSEPIGYGQDQLARPAATVPFRVQGVVPEATYTPMEAPATPTLDAKILIVAADGKEIELPAIKQALDMAGTPYEVWVASEKPGQLTPDKLSQGSRGFYQGVILTMGVPVYQAGTEWLTALTQAEWEALWAYEAAFKVRQATWYTWPTADYGFAPSTGAAETNETPLEASLTAAGAAAFPQLNPQAKIPIRYAYTYLAKPLDADTTTLLQDAAGNALAAVKKYPDGRENLAMTFDSNPYLTHSLVLTPSVIQWVTRGVHLGERRAYMSVQIDDVFYASDLWGGGEHRMDAQDLLAAAAWQRMRRLDPVLPDFKYDMVFNGEGSTGSYEKDTLTPTAKLLQGEFKWISHTYTHMDLNPVDEPTAYGEITANHKVASDLKLSSYHAESLVTGKVSGLKNPEAMNGMFRGGVRFVVSDTSRPGEDNPTPNAGIYNWVQPGILMIPRRPTNLFYNVEKPDRWVGEYNSMYRGYWGKDLTYAELLDKESDVLVNYLLKGELNPWMFHQSNLEAYEGGKSLLGDLLDATITKYKRYMRAPIFSPTMGDLGRTMAGRMAYNQAGVTATLTPGVSVTLTAQKAATVALTGVSGGSAIDYAGVPLTRVQLSAGQTVTLPLVSAPAPTPRPSATPTPKPTPKPKKNR